jgi:phosphoglycolate phosphatase
LKTRNSISAVIFDFDGTLAKLNINFSQMRKGIVGLIESYGVSLDGLRNLYVLEMIDAGKTLVSQKHPGRENYFAKQAISLIETIEVEAAKRGELIEGTKNMLVDLKKHNIKTGVVTRNCQLAVLEVFPDIRDYCDAVITREITRNVKPHPEHLLTVLESLDVKPEFASMVGDHPMDIKIGKDVGTLTIGVLTGYSSSDDLLKAGADLIIAKAADIVRILL